MPCPVQKLGACLQGYSSVAQDDQPFSTAVKKPRREKDGIRLLMCQDASYTASQSGRLAATGQRGPSEAAAASDTIHTLVT